MLNPLSCHRQAIPKRTLNVGALTYPRRMPTARKFLDRGRRVPLEGRPLSPDWDQLLYLGMRAVEKGRADDSPYLSAVMFEDIYELGRFSKPAPFDNELLRQWLDADEGAAVVFIRQQLGNVRAPDTGAEAREILGRHDCLSDALGTHRLTTEQAVWRANDVTWAVGWCSDCVRALLWRFDEGEAPVTTWPFYDHESSAL